MRLVDDDHVIQTLSSDRADQAFDVWILPRTRRRGNDQRYFQLDTATFAKFNAALDASPAENPRLRELLSRKAPWQR
jgi:hypothetical protein